MTSLLLKTLLGAALVGGVSATLALILGASGQALLGFWHANVLIGSGFVTFVGLLALQLYAQRHMGRRDLKKVFLQGCPPWMRLSLIGLSLAGFGVVLLLGLRGYEPPDGGVSSLLTGAFGLFLFPAGVVSFYSYDQKRGELHARCSNGHQIPLGAKFCPECGEHV